MGTCPLLRGIGPCGPTEVRGGSGLAGERCADIRNVTAKLLWLLIGEKWQTACQAELQGGKEGAWRRQGWARTHTAPEGSSGAGGRAGSAPHARQGGGGGTGGVEGRQAKALTVPAPSLRHQRRVRDVHLQLRPRGRHVLRQGALRPEPLQAGHGQVLQVLRAARAGAL